jgi:hypothetical protein
MIQTVTLLTAAISLRDLPGSNRQRIIITYERTAARRIARFRRRRAWVSRDSSSRCSSRCSGWAATQRSGSKASRAAVYDARQGPRGRKRVRCIQSDGHGFNGRVARQTRRLRLPLVRFIGGFSGFLETNELMR